MRGVRRLRGGPTVQQAGGVGERSGTHDADATAPTDVVTTLREPGSDDRSIGSFCKPAAQLQPVAALSLPVAAAKGEDVSLPNAGAPPPRWMPPPDAGHGTELDGDVIMQEEGKAQEAPPPAQVLANHRHTCTH